MQRGAGPSSEGQHPGRPAAEEGGRRLRASVVGSVRLGKDWEAAWVGLAPVRVLGGLCWALRVPTSGRAVEGKDVFLQAFYLVYLFIFKQLSKGVILFES